MARRRRLAIALAVLLIVCALAIALFLRGHAAPEPARLLPDAEGFIYINFKHVRAVTDFAQHPVSREPDYEDFVRQTGFVFERDLDEAAIAIHPAEVNTAEGTPELQRRYSEIFAGHYDASKLGHYLHQQAASVENYRDRDIFLIPHEGRPVRVVLLGPGLVAISNTTEPETIHGIIDRYHQLAAPFGGPALLREYYRRVPIASSAWAVLKMQSPTGQSTLPLPGGIGFSLPQGTVAVVSVRYLDPAKLATFASLKNIEFKIDAFTPSDADAEHLTQTASTFLQLFRGVQTSAEPRGPDEDVKAFFDSLAVRQDGKESILTADIRPGFIKKILTQAPAAVAAPPEPSPAEAASKGPSGPPKSNSAKQKEPKHPQANR